MEYDHCSILLDRIKVRVQRLCLEATGAGLRRTTKLTWRKGVFSGPTYTLECNETFWVGPYMMFFPYSTQQIDDGIHMNLKQIDRLVKNWSIIELGFRSKLRKEINKNSPKDCCERNLVGSDLACRTMLETFDLNCRIISETIKQEDSTQ